MSETMGPMETWVRAPKNATTAGHRKCDDSCKVIAFARNQDAELAARDARIVELEAALVNCERCVPRPTMSDRVSDLAARDARDGDARDGAAEGSAGLLGESPAGSLEDLAFVREVEAVDAELAALREQVAGLREALEQLRDVPKSCGQIHTEQWEGDCHQDRLAVARSKAIAVLATSADSPQEEPRV